MQSSFISSRGKDSKSDRLLIIDPNDSGNDVSGGSKDALLIFDKFHQTYNKLVDLMEDADERRDEMHLAGHQTSLLGLLLGGNYDSFTFQRGRLWNLNHRGYR